MANIVEDGTGKTDADAYVSAVDATTYWAAHGAPTGWISASDEEKELAIREATRKLDMKYRFRWRGSRYNETQALAWPRTAIDDYDGYSIAAETVPSDLADATTELALRHVMGTGTNPLFPDTESRTLKKHTVETQDKRESWEWSGQGGTVDDAAQSSTTVWAIVDALIAPLVHSGPLLERA